MLIDALRGGLSFLRDNPFAMVQAAKNASRLELSVPIDLLQWGIDRRPRGKGPERIELFAADPALGIGLTVDLYGTKIDVSAKITVEGIENLKDQLKVTLRVRDLTVKAPPGSPAAMMVQSMDFSKPGNLLKMMPMKHAALVEATDDRFVLDLLKIPALAKNPRLTKVLAALSFVQVRTVRAETPLLAVGLNVSPRAIPGALRAALG
jgi:hypothetical protein